ncbi:MAG TPA: efflux RND transporter periplasmic adaptor subunit [Gemmatimonadaceae bacterium]|nr:efflux RND transporter periplasmic adaptor subunit [Gemmatimonadaceae bacterium]
MKIRVRTLCVWLAAVASAACAKHQPDRQVTVPVRAAAATKIAAPVEITANGVAEPLQTVSVEAQVGGALTEVSFKEGDEVSAGQVLFRIDARPYDVAVRQAEAALARDLAQAENAQREAERYAALAEKDYVTKSQLGQVRANATALRASVVSDSAALESAKLNLAYCTIRAPIAGRTGGLLVRQGNLVKANGQPLVIINQIRPILVRFPVTQRDFLAISHRASQGSLAVGVTSADSVPTAEMGSLSFLDNAVDSLTGTVTAKARFDNASRKLWPGEYVRVSVRLEVIPDAIAVPSAALQSAQNGTYVYVIDDQNVARTRPVTIGETVGDLTVVRTGIKAGERVVTDGQSRLTPGAKVDVQPERATAETDSSRSAPARGGGRSGGR